MFEKIKTTLPPAKGRVLLSDPFLMDPNFRRTVALLCEHNEKGSFGFVLNRQLHLTIADVIEIDTLQEVPLYLGGPVQKDTLHFIHRDPEFAENSLEVFEGVYWGTDFEKVKEKLEENSLNLDNFRFFVGYSGWGEGQLEDEIKEQSWFVAEATEEMIFEDDEEELWKNILKNMGGGFKFLSNAPESPHMN